MSFVVVIPARFASTRLPGKPLLDIAGRPMIVRVMEKARDSGASRVIVATDHDDVFDVVKRHGGEVCMTSVTHQSGTERLAEVIDKFCFNDDEIIVNVQGDEPLIPPAIIQQVALNLQSCQHADIATLAVPIKEMDEVFNPNVVKVVRDKEGYALYFSRAAIPWDREKFAQLPPDNIGGYFLRHIGIYAYRAGFVRRYITWQESPLEKIELLEQLRVLWQGEKIYVDVAKESPSAGVDTPEDLQRVLRYLQQSEER